jgi:hypothetical protein
MLREIAATRQVPGEPPRRWFTSRSIDLFVWLDSEQSPIGFQICYDKQWREHALTWTKATGFAHMAVDSGETRPTRHKGAPILVANGAFDATRILEDFRRESDAVPAEFAAMIEDKLQQLSGAAA